MSYASPTGSAASPLSKYESPSIQQVTSPYLSESAHVWSLQHPTAAIDVQQSPEAVVAGDELDGEKGRQQSGPSTIIKATSRKHASATSSTRSSRRWHPVFRCEGDSKSKVIAKSEVSIVRDPNTASRTGKPIILQDRQTKSSLDHETELSCLTDDAAQTMFPWSHAVSKTGSWLKTEFAHSKVARRLFGKQLCRRRHSRESTCRRFSIAGCHSNSVDSVNRPKVGHSTNSKSVWS